MPDVIWSQDNFTKGELSPLMYARVSVQQYYNGLKVAQNCISYPQGGIGKRFGTEFRSSIGIDLFTNTEIFFETFQYLNECVYQILIYPDPQEIRIYLEGILVNTIASPYAKEDIKNLDFTVINDIFRTASQVYPQRPQDLKRSANAPNPIIGNPTLKLFSLTSTLQGEISAVRFTIDMGGTLPDTQPKISQNITYFARNDSGSLVSIYASSQDAANDTNHIRLLDIGANANLVEQNVWSLSDVEFKNFPTFDFDGGYETYTFTPSDTFGASKTLTSSTAIFTDEHVGGAFIGGSGIARITAVPAGPYPVTTCTIDIQQSFDNTDAISGLLSLLSVPAWSDKRGWPTKVSSYQSRAIFANSASLTNGFWASAINDYDDFNDLENDDDDAISWFPSSNQINFIDFIVPYRSLTIHSNSGVFSTPLSFETAITPKNFSLNLQDSIPSDKLQPRTLDNQIFIISGNHVHNLLWDGINNAYQSNIISILSDHLIRSPVDEAAYLDLNRPGSRYLFVINDDGSLAIFQTLISEEISGWTISDSMQHYGQAFFRKVASSLNGRCWFLIERQIESNASIPHSIIGFTENTLEATANNLSQTTATAVKFTAASVNDLPASIPSLQLDTFYWAIGQDTDNFKVYSVQEDAINDNNAFQFSNAGNDSTLNVHFLNAELFLEELSFDGCLDSFKFYSGAPTSTIAIGNSRFNAQTVKINGDGFSFTAQGNNNQIKITAHGEPVEVSEAYIGFPIQYQIEPLPLSISAGGIKSQNIAQPKRIRDVKFMFNNTIGGQINGIPIALNTFNDVPIGSPPQPSNGIFEMSIMNAWNDFDNPTFTITHDDPFDIRLIGVFYTVEI